MRATYDRRANAVYIYIKEGPPGCLRNGKVLTLQDIVDEKYYHDTSDILFEFSSNGFLAGIEVLGAEEILPREFLDQCEDITQETIDG